MAFERKSSGDAANDEQKQPSKRLYLTTDDVALMLNVSRRTMEGWRVTGTGPKFLKVGPGKRARVVYREHDILEWMQQYEFTSTAEIRKR